MKSYFQEFWQHNFLQILEAKKLFPVIGGIIRFSFSRDYRQGKVDAVVDVGKSLDVKNHLALRSSYCRVNLDKFFFRYPWRNR